MEPPALSLSSPVGDGTRWPFSFAGRIRWSKMRVCTVPSLVASAMALAALVLLLSSSSSSTLEWTVAESDDEDPGPLRVDKLLAGLLADGFDDGACRSRYRYKPPQRETTRRPSQYLIGRLRQQEALQRKCGPGTAAYANATRRLRSAADSMIGGGVGTEEFGGDECKYLVSVAYTGLGNKMLAAASAFLYALLTGRVLLADMSDGRTDKLFCEPFPGSSWLVSSDFPLKDMGRFDGSHPQALGNLLRSGALSKAPPFVYLHLDSSNSFDDRLFFCDDTQRRLTNITWLTMRTNLYIVPQLYLMSSFQDQLVKLFPDKEATFHLTARYLFHPSNRVWSMITRYYNTHLAAADERIGIQVRTQYFYHPPPEQVLDQVLKCSLQTADLLPGAGNSAEEDNAMRRQHSKAILVTSLSSSYAKQIREMYRHRRGGNDSIGVYQPSHEGRQKFGDREHNMKALAEIYLLSLCDDLVTSPASTFGYVAQGLGGLKPWLMTRTQEPSYTFDAPCSRVASIEPCNHAPTKYDCRVQSDVDLLKAAPFIRACEDIEFGIKIIQHGQM